MKKRICCLLLIGILCCVLLSACGGNGTPAPDFRVYDAAGEALCLSALRARPVVVNFWATWCPPCVSELPHFDAAAKEYGDQVAFLMINVNTDSHGKPDTATALSFMQEKGFSFPVYFDADYEASIAYGVQAIPVTLWIDRHGNFVHSYVGMLNEEYLNTYLEKIMA